MKDQIVLSLVIIVISAFGATVHATPITFTFSGTVAEVTVDDPLVDTGIEVGDSVSYSLLIDFDRLGTQSTWDGTQYVTQELDAATYGVDTFYVEYLDGFLIDDHLIAHQATPSILNYGHSLFGMVMMFAGTQDHGLTLNTFDGINWMAMEEALDANGNPELISIASGGTLTAVPEPASVLFLCCGLIGFGFAGFIRRSRSKR